MAMWFWPSLKASPIIFVISIHIKTLFSLNAAMGHWKWMAEERNGCRTVCYATSWYKNWLKNMLIKHLPGTRAFSELEQLIDNVRLQKDIKKLSPAQQTSSIEAYHSLLNQFAPKMTVFSYEGMICRYYDCAVLFIKRSCFNIVAFVCINLLLNLTNYSSQWPTKRYVMNGTKLWI